MPFSFLRIELTLCAFDAALQPPRPVVSIFQSFSVLTAGAVETVGRDSVCAPSGAAKASAANKWLRLIVSPEGGFDLAGSIGSLGAR
jgi:hypothetical protein